MRTFHDQAKAMFNKFTMGDFKTYHGATATRVADAYRRGMKGGESKTRIIDDMADIIDRNFSPAHPLSHHLTNRAVDFSNNGMTESDKSLLAKIITRHGGAPLRENRPRHIHGSF
jgi:hypothetical protein